MGKRYDQLQPDQIAFIGDQHVYFVGTAAPGARVNLSPKGMDSLRVLTPTRILWLNLTGSGNETAAHLQLDPRITLMWCSFTTRPIILRAYGNARAVHHGDPDWSSLKPHLPDQPGARQIVDVTIDLVQSSCGFAVPFMDFREDRPVLQKWATDKGPDGLRDYWDTRNRETIDGLPTGTEANL
ncbi:pyridoxamine 5'-phosphate oxidase family protein [Tabrizicola piscis]|uniref:Pyridoxamine 5'-phosphate oxidase family protein n=1 Tax=Tabrizicola piscis TaxID=2494374 RepID=A0A3S8U330_9RHOB|nr:pyridoxamine 5'-phosphate oxidase family protein [Tabrizicola piscis]AZL58001.1 pyridoxamine 5'-phosphate oxidase family protein [Tabrizicola piscis]